MSTQLVMSIYDKKMNTYSRPIYVKHQVEAQRSIIGVLRTKESMLAQYPSDYELYSLGVFDEQTGAHTMEEKPRFVMNISELLEEQNHE